MSNKYIITSNEDNSFTINGDEKRVEVETKEMISFCLQYLYTILNPHEINLSESNKTKILDVVKSFDFDEKDMEEMSRLIVNLGYKLNKVMMTYDNGVPKEWEDDI